MPLSTGTKLGSYEILAPLGAGGMGEVYRAKDTKLDREVAIKVLPTAFAQHPERLARFEREAKVLASLNHPNIATIYAVEESPDGKALVMELVKGQTLKGPVPFDTALKYAAQIASALDAAHEKGITHRDLKPANIMVTPDGAIKVLDFGLAAVTQPSQSEGEIGTNMATLTMSPTSAGMIMGTAAYMSPEQASGQTVDRRADIWAFGVVLWELLTGKQLFQGTTVSHILASVLKDEPDYTQVPYKVRRLLRRCLEKDPQKRLFHIGDVMELVDIDTEAPPASVTTSAQSRFGKLPWVAAAAATVIAIGLGVGLYRSTRPAELKSLVRLDVDLGASLGSRAGGPDTILSPDGTRLVYVSQGKLFTRRMDQPQAVELAGTEGAFAPFFSPDGQWVAFFTQRKLKKISVEGGAAVVLGDTGTPRGGSWGEDGNIIAAFDNSNVGLARIPSAGGSAKPVTQLEQGAVTHRWPQILPGGKAVLFTSHALTGAFDGANIEVVSLADHRLKTLQRGGTFGRYLPSSKGVGHLLYVSKGTMFAVPFDLDRLEVSGVPAPMLGEVAYSPLNGSAQFDVSRNGTLVYQHGGATGANLSTVQFLDAMGKAQPLLAKPGVYERPRVSPDGQRVALGDGTDIWVYEARRDTMTRLTFGGARHIVPVWRPDGRYILFSGEGGIWWARADGAATPQPLIQSKNQLIPYSFTPDGKRLVYDEVNLGTAYDIWTVPIEDDETGLRAGKPEIFLRTPADERNPTFSRDGRWLAYTSNESGTYQVYVRAFPNKGGKWQISSAGGAYPVWSSNGHELFFRGDDNRIMVTTYAAKADSFVPDKPQLWSDKRLANFGTIGTSNYDVEPGGKRIVAVMPVETPEAQQSLSHVIFLMNFFDELQRKAPVAK